MAQLPLVGATTLVPVLGGANVDDVGGGARGLRFVDFFNRRDFNFVISFNSQSIQ